MEVVPVPVVEPEVGPGSEPGPALESLVNRLIWAVIVSTGETAVSFDGCNELGDALSLDLLVELRPAGERLEF